MEERNCILFWTQFWGPWQGKQNGIIPAPCDVCWRQNIQDGVFGATRMARMARGRPKQPDWGHMLAPQISWWAAFLAVCHVVSSVEKEGFLDGSWGSKHPPVEGEVGAAILLKILLKHHFWHIRWSKPRFKTRINKLHLLMGKWKNVCSHLPPLWNLQEVKSYTAFEQTKLIKEERHIGLKWGCGRRL